MSVNVPLSEVVPCNKIWSVSVINYDGRTVFDKTSDTRIGVIDLLSAWLRSQPQEDKSLIVYIRNGVQI